MSTTRVNEVVGELRQTQDVTFDLLERIRAASDVLRRTTIESPLNGIIVGLGIHTIGGVIAPGEDLIDIVTVGKRLVVEAHVQPEDIDSVHPGLNAQVILTAFSRRDVSPLNGTVISVSADRITDSRTSQPYFLARIALPDDPLPVHADLELYPGMQAGVMIVTGERTAIGYLLRAVASSFNRALREE